MPTDAETTGLVMWALLFAALFVIRSVCKRRLVSRNHTDPKWEQDAPYPECFEIDEEDDL